MWKIEKKAFTLKDTKICKNIFLLSCKLNFGSYIRGILLYLKPKSTYVENEKENFTSKDSKIYF